MGCALALAGPARSACAEQAGPTTRPMLDELNRETTAAYRQVRGGLYRVQLPQPRWVHAYAYAALNKWDKALDPTMRRQLEHPADAPLEAIVEPRPAGDHDAAYIVVRPQLADRSAPRPGVLGEALQLDEHASAPTGFAPNNVGLLLDEQGHVLVPLYVERETVGEQQVRLAGADGTGADARFIGSDRPTNLTLLRLDKPPGGKPVSLAAARPEPGSLVLSLSPVDGSARLCLWTEGGSETGVIASTGGEISGIARQGQFLSASACNLVARELIRYGSVRRATLGVVITELRPDEPDAAAAGHAPRPVTRPAMRVDEVIAGSPADKAGLKPGDLVLAVAGQPVTDLPGFATAIAERGEGSTQLQVRRGEQSLGVTVVLEQQK